MAITKQQFEDLDNRLKAVEARFAPKPSAPTIDLSWSTSAEEVVNEAFIAAQKYPTPPRRVRVLTQRHLHAAIKVEASNRYASTGLFVQPIAPLQD